MNIELINPKNGNKKTAPLGYSWTTLIFGFFVPFYRKDWLYTALMFFLECIFLNIGNGYPIFIVTIVFSFIYNRLYFKKLISQGYLITSRAPKIVAAANQILGADKVNQMNEQLSEYENEVTQQKEKHLALVREWQTEDLEQYATKLDQIKLKKTEYCYYVSPGEATWSEEKTKVKRINYGGLTGNIHIAKGLNYRLGSIRTEAKKTNYWDDILTGHIFLTNRRVIAMNDEQAKSYPFTKLMRVIPYSDGVELISDAGKRTIIKDLPEAERFNIYLDRLTTK